MTVVASNSTRISKRFADLRATGELGIVAYLVAGDPSFDATLKYVLALAEGDADIIELGVPFSDPLADGPTIQRADFHGRSPRKNLCLLLRFSLSHLAHRRHRREGCFARRSPGTLAPRPRRHATSYRRRLRHLASRPCLGSGWSC